MRNADNVLGPHPKDKRQKSCQGGKRALREDGREDAPQASRAVEAEREAQQIASLITVNIISWVFAFILVYLVYMERYPGAWLQSFQWPQYGRDCTAYEVWGIYDEFIFISYLQWSYMFVVNRRGK